MNSQALVRHSLDTRISRRALLRRAGGFAAGILAAEAIHRAEVARSAMASPGPAASLPSPAAPGTPVPAEPLRIDLIAGRQAPPEVDVAVGTTVAWVNRGTDWLSVAALNGSFDSGRIAPGQVFLHRFTRRGSYLYVCKNHAIRDMTGRIEVR